MAARQSASIPENDHHGDPRHELHEGEEEAALHHGAVVDVAVRRVGRGERGVVALFAAEGVQHAHARERLLQAGGHVADAIAHQRVGDRRTGAKDERRDDQERHDAQGGQREPPIEDEEEADGTHEGQRVRDQGGDAVGDELVERIDVVGEAAHDPAGTLAAEEVEAELL